MKYFLHDNGVLVYKGERMYEPEEFITKSTKEWQKVKTPNDVIGSSNHFMEEIFDEISKDEADNIIGSWN